MLELIREKVREIWNGKSEGYALLSLIITIAASMIIMAFLIPIAMEQFLAANTTGWDTPVQTIWNAIPMLCFVGIIIAVIYIAIKRGG